MLILTRLHRNKAEAMELTMDKNAESIINTFLENRRIFKEETLKPQGPYSSIKHQKSRGDSSIDIGCSERATLNRTRYVR